MWRDLRDYSTGEMYYKRKIISVPVFEQTVCLVASSKLISINQFFSDKITLRFAMPINKPVQVRMYNLYGSAVFKQLYSNAASPLINKTKSSRK